MDSEDPSPLNPLQAPFCGSLVNRLTQEYATLFPPASVLAYCHIRHYLPLRTILRLRLSLIVICPSDDISATRVICCCNSSWPGD